VRGTKAKKPGGAWLFIFLLFLFVFGAQRAVVGRGRLELPTNGLKVTLTPLSM
jgi:hypothetical protein